MRPLLSDRATLEMHKFRQAPLRRHFLPSEHSARAATDVVVLHILIAKEQQAVVALEAV
jgi:hypothetical protein